MHQQVCLPISLFSPTISFLAWDMMPKTTQIFGNFLCHSLGFLFAMFVCLFVGLAYYQAKDIVSRFIIEFKGFWPLLGNNNNRSIFI
jgi:hypothetical protein